MGTTERWRWKGGGDLSSRLSLLLNSSPTGNSIDALSMGAKSAPAVYSCLWSDEFMFTGNAILCGLSQTFQDILFKQRFVAISIQNTYLKI